MPCGTNRRAAAAFAIVASAALASCRSRANETGTPAARTAVSASAPAGAVPHGDHNPHHGGVVMMKGDLHYEVVLDRAGRLQLYFTDAVREDLPASIASAVTITIQRPHESEERVPLHIDDSGESWIGTSRAVAAPESTTAAVAFAIQGEPYSIVLPFVVPR